MNKRTWSVLVLVLFASSFLVACGDDPEVAAKTGTVKISGVAR